VLISDAAVIPLRGRAGVSLRMRSTDSAGGCQTLKV